MHRREDNIKMEQAGREHQYWMQHPQDRERWRCLAKPVIKSLVSIKAVNVVLTGQATERTLKILIQFVYRDVDCLDYRMFKKCDDCMALQATLQSWVGRQRESVPSACAITPLGAGRITFTFPHQHIIP
jgi:hypothetical protein